MTFTSDDDLAALDSIERTVEIDATAERVWALVSVPGWWICDDELVANDVTDEGDGVFRVEHATYGVFRIARLRTDEPRYVSFRWLGGGAGEGAEGPDTLVEFHLTERTGGTTLRVVESGFTHGEQDPRRWLGHREDNVRGWEQVLAAAARQVVAG